MTREDDFPPPPPPRPDRPPKFPALKEVMRTGPAPPPKRFHRDPPPVNPNHIASVPVFPSEPNRWNRAAPADAISDELAVRETRAFIRNHMLECTQELLEMGLRGRESVSEEWQSLPKYLSDLGMIDRDSIEKDYQGKDIKSAKAIEKREQKSVKRALCNPDVLEALEGQTIRDGMILVRRTVTRSGGDRAALTYLIDRIAGRPKVEIEHSTTDSRQTLSDTIMNSIAKVFSQPLESESNDDIVIDAESE